MSYNIKNVQLLLTKFQKDFLQPERKKYINSNPSSQKQLKWQKILLKQKQNLNDQLQKRNQDNDQSSQFLQFNCKVQFSFSFNAFIFEPFLINNIKVLKIGIQIKNAEFLQGLNFCSSITSNQIQLQLMCNNNPNIYRSLKKLQRKIKDIELPYHMERKICHLNIDWSRINIDQNTQIRITQDSSQRYDVVDNLNIHSIKSIIKFGSKITIDRMHVRSIFDKRYNVKRRCQQKNFYG